MLRAVGHSYAMGQSPPEVVEAAGQVLVADHTSGGGIAEAARRAGLL
jgi:hydroxymethylpyrimidine pyrophosphatase-like HAD family hydrolase